MMRLDTKQSTVRCRCVNGHVFTSGIFVCVNVDNQSDILGTFSDNGTQLVKCRECGEIQPLAEPVELISPSRKRFGVFIPELLAHKELDIRAQTANQLADADLNQLPSYVGDFDIIVGKRALEEWLDQGDLPSKDVREITQVDEDIHAAFVDLKDAEDRPSMDSCLSELDDVNKADDKSFEEGLATGNAELKDSTQSPIKKLASNPPQVNVAKDSAAAKIGRSPIDFAAILSQEEERNSSPDTDDE